MIAFLKGVLAGKTATAAYVDVGGVGFAVGMSPGEPLKAARDGLCGGGAHLPAGARGRHVAVRLPLA